MLSHLCSITFLSFLHLPLVPPRRGAKERLDLPETTQVQPATNKDNYKIEQDKGPCVQLASVVK